MTDKLSGVLPPGNSMVSYTQFSMYTACPHSWKLAYGLGLRSKEPSIHLIFGTAMHNTIQTWLGIMYNDSEFAADDFDYKSFLLAEMEAEFSSSVESWGSTFSTPDELEEFYNDGVKILDDLIGRNAHVFDSRNMKLYGIEVPVLGTPSALRPTVNFLGFIDVALDGPESMIIRDIKTSTSGWGSYQRNDTNKLSQLWLYKYYFAEHYKVDMRAISVDYLILNRTGKIKVDIYIPPQNSRRIKQVVSKLGEFVEFAFSESGTPDVEKDFPAITGYGNENCRFCEFRDKPDLCPVNKRIPNIEVLTQ